VQSVEAATLSDEEIELNVSVKPAASAVPVSLPKLEPAFHAAPRELELKFTTDSSGLAFAFASPLLEPSAPDARGRALTSVYFDTPAGDLKSQGMVLRVRRAGRCAPVMTLKWKPAATEGLFSRAMRDFR
jgi:hypothetical protein